MDGNTVTGDKPLDHPESLSERVFFSSVEFRKPAFFHLGVNDHMSHPVPPPHNETRLRQQL